MSRIQACFEKLNNEKRKALIPFLTAGDPAPETTVALMQGLVSGGADLLELGIPFSDPMADGPVIQRASERALEHRTSLDMVLNMVSEFRTVDQDTPVILMGYLNPIEVMGYKVFSLKAAEVGVDGVLIVDLPPEEAGIFNQLIDKQGINQVFLLSPTTSIDRIKRICEMASGFIYYVSLKGVTGSDRLDIASVEAKVNEIRNHTSLPIGVGFGIKDGESAAEVGKISDAVIIGSALVERVADSSGSSDELIQDLSSFISSIREALDNIQKQ